MSKVAPMKLTWALIYPKAKWVTYLSCLDVFKEHSHFLNSLVIKNITVALQKKKWKVFFFKNIIFIVSKHNLAVVP